MCRFDCYQSCHRVLFEQDDCKMMECSEWQIVQVMLDSEGINTIADQSGTVCVGGILLTAQLVPRTQFLSKGQKNIILAWHQGQELLNLDSLRKAVKYWITEHNSLWIVDVLRNWEGSNEPFCPDQFFNFSLLKEAHLSCLNREWIATRDFPL